MATADAALKQAEADARRDHGTADANTAAAQAAWDAFTENADGADPDHDGWAELLRDEQDAARGRLTEARETAAQLRKDADQRVEAARAEKTAADERLDTALLSARAPDRARDDATARRDEARDAFETRRDELDALRDAAERAASEYHRVRAGADQLTRWHRLAATSEGREELEGIAEPPPVTFTPPPKPPAPKSPAPPRYTRTGTGTATVLTSPTSETYTLHDVPRDGDAFLRSLAHGLELAAPGLLAAEGIDLADPGAMSGLRRKLASWLTDHADDELLASVAPDFTDAFTAEEIAAAGLDLGTDTPARREFDGLGGLIPHAVDLDPATRAELAVAQLLRRGDAPSEAGWDHGAADLLPLLAARTFGVRVTVVDGDGAFQDFGGPADPKGALSGLVGPSPHTGAHVVLSLDDRHYRLAVPVKKTPTAKGKESTSVEGASVVGELASVKGTSVVGELASVKGLSGAGELASAEGTSAVEESAPVKETPVVEESAPVKETPVVEESAPLKETPVVEESAPVKETPAPVHLDAGDRARGRRVPVPATGECLLYSFMAGDPVHLRARLTGLAATDRAAHDWLGTPDTVRADLRREAGIYSTTGKLPAGPARAALHAMRAHVEDYVARSEGRLHPQIVGQFRQTVADAFARRVRGMNRAERLAALAHHGVDGIPVPEALDPAELLARYVDARTATRPADLDLSVSDARALYRAEAEELSPRRMFAYLEAHGLLPDPGDLDDAALERLLSTVYPQSTAPLDDSELPVLLDAVVNWEDRWGTPAGEIFLPLLAHAFDLRVDVVRSLPSGTRRVNRVGPDTAPRRTEVHYNGSNHYDGSDAPAQGVLGGPALPPPPAEGSAVPQAAPTPVTAGADTGPTLGADTGPTPGDLGPPATTPEAIPDPVRELASRLPGLPTADRDAALEGLTPEERERLAADPALVDALRTALDPAEFASVAANLMTQVPAGVERPVSARDRARTQVARLLQDPEVAARLLKGGSRVVVVPKGEAMTSLDAFRDLRGGVSDDGRPWERVRGAGRRTAAVTEENLLGERTTVPTDGSAYPDGYSTTVHEVAHTVHLHGLDDEDRARVTEAFRATERAGEAGSWPDGDLHGHDAHGRRSAPNYSSRDEREFFAQLTNVYLMANGGTDPYTGRPRNNGGPEWVRVHQPALYPLLRRLYGEGPRPRTRHPRSVEPARPRGVRPSAVNPVDATDVENEALDRARALWEIAEGGRGDDSDAHTAVRALWDGAAGEHRPQPHPPAPRPVPPPVRPERFTSAPPPAEDPVQRRLRELWAVVDATFGSRPLPEQTRTALHNSLRVIDAARTGHPRFGREPLDLDGITRMLLHLPPDAPVDAALHFDAFSLVGSAHRRGRAGTLDAVAAYGLTRQGYPQQSELHGPDGAPHGRNWTGRPGLTLHLDRVADQRGVRPAPWGTAAHAVVAERDDEGRLLLAGQPVSDEEFAELVRHDSRRQPDVPVVVLMAEDGGRNESLARLIADRAGTRAWFSYGDLRLQPAPDGRRVPFLAEPATGSDPAGTWVPADPGLVPDDPGATVTAANGTPFPDTDIQSYPLVTADGQELTGRAFLDAHDMALREQSFRPLSAVQHYSNVMEGLPGVYAGRESGALPLPRGLAGSYVAVGHGDQGRTTLPRRSTGANQAVHPRQLGRMLARRASLRALPPERPVWLLVCELSMTRPDQDLLTHPPSSQYVANETGRTVFTVNMQVGTSEAEGERPPRLLVFDDPDHPVGRIEEFPPEPGTDALDALADLGGLPPQLPGRTDRARHWVRALRRTHGVRVDSDPAREAEFHELIEGFGALERLRFRNAGDHDPGPLTWGGLHQIVGRYAARDGLDGALSAASLEHLLRAALDGGLSPHDTAVPGAAAAPPPAPVAPPSPPSPVGREAEAALLAALGGSEPLAGLLPAEQPARGEAFRQWLSDAVREEDLTEDQVPPLTPSATIPLELLAGAGHRLTDAQTMEGALLGDRLPVTGLTVGPAVRLRLLLADPTLGAGLPAALLTALALRALGVRQLPHAPFPRNP
ncbi:lonely Cys domain-containing protein [Streptomyces sp. NPDC048002]|uniref:lonely Cys domain-containing protein n=1 Tax=Streptomyces sp. NPDC048002 TaxID=3154344 RepID=UPI0033CF76FC